MRSRIRLSLLLVGALLLSACATKPQMPVELASESLSPARQEKVGVAVAKLPKATLHLPGANCLLCIMAAQAANSTLAKHADTLPAEDLMAVKEQIAAALKKKGVAAVVVREELELDKLADAGAASAPNAARKDFAPLKQKYSIDKLVVVEIETLGIERAYSAYFPNGDPKGVVRGKGYMVNLSKNTYEWYQPVAVYKAADGAWDEPARFPGLTNAYFQAIEIGRDQLVQPFGR